MKKEAIEVYIKQLQAAKGKADNLESAKLFLSNVQGRIERLEGKSDSRPIGITNYNGAYKGEIHIPLPDLIPIAEAQIARLQSELDNFALTII